VKFLWKEATTEPQPLNISTNFTIIKKDWSYSSQQWHRLSNSEPISVAPCPTLLAVTKITPKTAALPSSLGKVRWENIGVKIIGNVALAMGNYYFTPANGGDEVKVEYSFAYTKDKDGNLKIILHDSHIPYKPEETH